VGLTLETVKHDHELNADNDVDLMKKNQILLLAWVGFLFKNDKVVKSTATMDDLENTNKQIKVVGQIVHLKMYSSTIQSWDWSK